MNKVETWKAEKHGFDVWNDVVEHARAGTGMSEIPEADLERMKWYGIFYRKRVEDGRYMIRIRIPGCELTSEQARAVAAVARIGYSIVDVTTRGNCQVQGLHITDLPRVIDQLSTVGLTSRQTGHDNVRNVMTHPWAGLDPAELIDARPLCRRLTAIFLDDRLLSNLPRKFNVAVDGRAVPASHCWTQDTSFVAARREDGSLAFHWLLAGTQGQNPHLAWKMPVWVTEAQAPEVLFHTLHVFREQGSRERRDKARLRYLIEQIGDWEFLARVEHQLGYPLERCDAAIPPIDEHEDFIGWYPQKQEGLWALGVSIPLGRLTHVQLDELAELSEQCGDATLRTAYDQGIVVPNITTARRAAAVRALNRVGLEHETDSITRNIIACTGRQFCNIAVSETKGHAFGLIDTLRAKGVKLAGIKINMSGCPSSCAQTYTSDIGLKGVRVRREMGSCDAFDVYLGGGAQGKVELGRLYRKGVDLQQLPEMIREVVWTYDRDHQFGQTFSQFWRARLASDHEPSVLKAEDYRPEVWECEVCSFRHSGDDPPIFCPKCASLRRNFVRISTADEPQAVEAAPAVPALGSPVKRSDGYRVVTSLAELMRDSRRAIQIEDRELALFLSGEQVYCLDGICPHEGGPMAQGELTEGILTCPWHGWAFRCDNGQAADGNGCALHTYPVKIEDGQVLVALGSTSSTGVVPCVNTTAAPAERNDDSAVRLRVIGVIEETPDVKTIRLDNAARRVPLHRVGQHVKVCVQAQAGPSWRSFTLSSPPTRPDILEVTVKRNPSGIVSRAIHNLAPDDEVAIKGPQGSFIFDPERHKEALVLAAAGSGITPAMAILRTVHDLQLELPVTLLYGCRSGEDVIFARELDALRLRLANFRMILTLSRTGAEWKGATGRVGPAMLARHVPEPARSRYFLCGPGDFMPVLKSWLLDQGTPETQIHSEQFGKSARRPPESATMPPPRANAASSAD
jgi:ferredoxin-nitrite reductase